MTARERFSKIAHFELTDELFLSSYHQWFWYDALKRWVKEGAPERILQDDYRAEYFGFDRVEVIPIISDMLCLGKSFGPPYAPPFLPLFERKILEEDERHRVVIDEGGRKILEYKEQPERMPQWLEFPVKTKKDWDMIKKRLDPDSPERFPAWWEDRVKCWRERDYPLGIAVGSFFGFLREIIGLENLCVMYYDNPSLIHEMNEWIEYFELKMLKRALVGLQFDFACFWEDMAYNKGSLISPKIFREFMMPYYNKITDLLRSHGTDVILVDSDGNTEELIPLWIESGINGQFPLEVTAGIDAVKLRKKFGKDFILIGNIDKRALIKGKQAIDEELKRKVSYLISQGGYFPAVDHFTPPEVTFQNYMYFIESLKKTGSCS